MRLASDVKLKIYIYTKSVIAFTTIHPDEITQMWWKHLYFHRNLITNAKIRKICTKLYTFIQEEHSWSSYTRMKTFPYSTRLHHVKVKRHTYMSYFSLEETFKKAALKLLEHRQTSLPIRGIPSSLPLQPPLHRYLFSRLFSSAASSSLPLQPLLLFISKARNVYILCYVLV